MKSYMSRRIASLDPARCNERRKRSTRLTGQTTAALIVGALVLGCTPRVNTHGDPLVADRIGQVVPGVHMREDVALLLGTPSTVSPFDNNSWYYISSQTETVAFFDKDVTEREVITVHFDDAGVVTGVESFGKERGREVDYVSRVTPTFGIDLSVAQEFFSNIGRFNKEDTEGRGRDR